MLMVKGLIRWFLQTVVFAAVLLIPAGTWHWPRGILFLVVFRRLALVVLPVVVAPVIGRILVEEATLRKILPGYPTYMGSVRSRLVSGIWSSDRRTS
ncbi:MAG: hypothetical protein P8Y93_06300 [Acidobacteriota bacterium]